MTIGTKSVLFGAHCFFLHPFFVAMGWWKLYGFPLDPRLWVAFIVHDLGYLGKPNMDGPEGETHPELGARIMHWLFDRRWFWLFPAPWDARPKHWYHFTLLHSRYYAKRLGLQYSRLCLADKLSFCYTPRWLYLPMVTATGEIKEYLKNAKTADSGHWTQGDYSANVKLWHANLCKYMVGWVEAHKNGGADTWTNANRHARG